jgi:hypothetical protein
MNQLTVPERRAWSNPIRPEQAPAVGGTNQEEP